MAAGTTYELITTTTLSVDTADITFSSISSAYTDLRLVIVGRSTRSGADVDTLGIRFNSDTGTNYSHTSLAGNGSTAYSARQSNISYWYMDYFPAALAAANVVGMAMIEIFSYTGSTNKTGLITQSIEVNSATYSKVEKSVHLWRNTSAINAIRLYSTTSSNLKSGFTATLYGIKAA